jgi:hypothetical protein
MHQVERLRAMLTENAYGVDDSIDAAQLRQPGGRIKVTREVRIDRRGRIAAVAHSFDHRVPRGTQRYD